MVAMTIVETKVATVADMVAMTIVEADLMTVADRRVHTVDDLRAPAADRQVPTRDHREDPDPDPLAIDLLNRQ